MVGVPRSAGCRICVQRRVRCDGARPICNNCKKGNRPCPGYGPGVKFQDEGPKLREKFQKGQTKWVQQCSDDDSSSWAVTTSSGTSSTDSSPSPSESGHWNILGLDVEPDAHPSRVNMFGFVEGKTKAYLDLDLFDVMWQSSGMGGIGSDSPFATSINHFSMLTQPVLSPDCQQIQLLANFTQSITPPESRFLPKALRSQGTWLSQLPSLSGANLLLDSAIRAVTLVHIGRMHRNEMFITESRPYYGKALRLLTTAITNKEMGMDNKTLCATILLSFYEMFASDDDASWVRHAGGAGTLMRMRGAERHRYGFDRDIFLAYRHTLVIEALSNNVPSFLDEPEWRQLTKDIYNDLLQKNQIPVDRIGIFEVAEEFHSEMAAISVASSKAHHLDLKITEFGLSDDDDIQPVFRQLQARHDALQRLYKRWLANLKMIGHVPPLRPVDDPVMPFQYQYTNVFIASFNVGFWTTLMLTNSCLYPLAKVLGLPTTALVLENEEYAMDSCRSVDFMLTSSFLGPFFTIYALRYAYRIFTPGDIRSDWALCKLIEIGDRRMLFAKAKIGGGAGQIGERPEMFLASARQRLDEYNLAYRSRNEIDGQT